MVDIDNIGDVGPLSMCSKSMRPIKFSDNNLETEGYVKKLILNAKILCPVQGLINNGEILFDEEKIHAAADIIS